ncbi:MULTISPECIES: hypothetical protein [unclassified Streptomyces]|uniref:hypothetical protein n=1 Tax=unclassified Streptomyces TaxID=2593676 RepID=UPI002E1636BB|nr:MULTISPECIES: hypothetical protein [unclassified Streptomyces]WSR26811.1 hypothetical protein OG573_12210 [Streptomyces sp. NBC_01205]
MSTAPNLPLPPRRPEEPHPLREIREVREIRKSLPERQLGHFDAELADTDIDALPDMLHRWATLGSDGFLEQLGAAPFEGLEFGQRSYDDAADGE